MSGSGAIAQTPGNTPQRTSKYHGLTWLEDLQVWKVEITVKRQKRWIGCAASEVGAAIAYDDALFQILSQDATLRITRYNFGIAGDERTAQAREVAFAQEARQEATHRVTAQSSSSASQSHARTILATAQRRSRQRTHSEMDQAPSDSRKRKKRKGPDQAEASNRESAAAAPAPRAAPTTQTNAERPGDEYAAVFSQIVQEIYDLNWICADQEPMPLEIRQSGFFKLKFSIFGISWAFAFRAQQNYDYPVFLPLDMEIASTKLSQFIRMFFARPQSGENEQKARELIWSIARSPVIPFHPVIPYFCELVLDSNVRMWEQFPLRRVDPPPRPGPHLVPISPRASPAPGIGTQLSSPPLLRRSEQQPSEVFFSNMHVPFEPNVTEFINSLSQRSRDANNRQGRTHAPDPASMQNNGGVTRPRSPQ